MLKKLKMTTFAAVLGLFGFVLVPAAPVFAESLAFNKANYERCLKKRGKSAVRCFKRVAAKMIASRTQVCSKKGVRSMISLYNKDSLKFCGDYRDRRD